MSMNDGQTKPTSLSYAAYGLLGMPLAMSALPVYVQIPAYYSTRLGLALGTVGWILFAARLIDAMQDPLLGHIIDRLTGRLSVWFAASGILLTSALLGMWLPPVAHHYLAGWLALMLVLAYLAHSMLNIPYLAWGAGISHRDSGALLGAAAWREGIGLLGVILASVIPALILTNPNSTVWLFWYNLGFAAVLAMAITALLTAAPAWQRGPVVPVHTLHGEAVAGRTKRDFLQQWRAVRSHHQFRKLLAPYLINAISVAVPATLVMFFINDRLQASEYAPACFTTYFCAAALGMPFWVSLAKRIGVAKAWRIGMLLAIIAFIGTIFLQTGAISPFFLICFASGLALGADLVLPTVLLAQVIEGDPTPAVYFGIWTLLGKLALSFSGLALPLLEWLNYQPGQTAGMQLSLVYAALPCALKCVSFLLLGTFVNLRPVHGEQS